MACGAEFGGLAADLSSYVGDCVGYWTYRGYGLGGLLAGAEVDGDASAATEMTRWYCEAGRRWYVCADVVGYAES